MKTAEKLQKRIHRHSRVRAKVSGTETRPRLAVFKSNTGISAQLINDEKGETIAAATSQSQKGATPKERAEAAAAALAAAAKKSNIESVVFDHGGFGYTGTIKTFADAARAAGLTF